MDNYILFITWLCTICSWLTTRGTILFFKIAIKVALTWYFFGHILLCRFIFCEVGKNRALLYFFHKFKSCIKNWKGSLNFADIRNFFCQNADFLDEIICNIKIWLWFVSSVFALFRIHHKSLYWVCHSNGGSKLRKNLKS